MHVAKVHSYNERFKNYVIQRCDIVITKNINYH